MKTTYFHRLAMLAVTLVASLGRFACAEPVADRVYGQPDLYSYVPGNSAVPANARLGKPRGVAVTKDGVYISDESFSRVLFFPHGKTEATRVYGQADFESVLQNYRGISADSLALPVLMDASEAGLAVADWRNSRAVFYKPGETTASLIYGQPHAYSTIPTYSYDPMLPLKYPFGAAIDKVGGVYVADSMDMRVVYYPPGTNVGSRIYDRTGVGSAQYFNFLYGVAVDDNGLYIADCFNNRVVFYPHGSEVATRVYGQPDFNSIDANHGGISASSLNQPTDIAVDSTGVYIADMGNLRVLYYPGTSTTASVVYGQRDFQTVEYGLGPNRIATPWSVAADDTAVYASDIGAARVLRFPKAGVPVANRLAYRTAPAGAAAGAPLSIQPVVEVRRVDGSLASDYNGEVVLGIVPGSGPDCARLVGGTTNAVNGVATFSGVKIDTPGAYKIEAQSGTLTGVESSVVTIAAPAAAAGAGDLDRNGVANIADTALALRVLMGLDAFPND